MIFLVNGLAQAQSPTPQGPAVVTDDQVNAVARELYCPVCENIPLDVCGTTACQQWRVLIRQKIAAGESTQQIRQDFANQYGDRVLSTPPLAGFSLLIYILPPVVILVAAVGLGLALRRMRRKPAPSRQATSRDVKPTPDDPYSRQLEDDLRRRES